MSDMLTYRPATIDDLSEIVKIYNSVIAGRMVTADIEPVSVESRRSWFESHRENRPLLMILQNDEVAGWLSFSNFYGREAYKITAEISIYLEENFRGKGLGKEILKHSLKLASELKIRTLLAFIFAHNVPSLQLFLKCGFEISGNLEKIALLDETERDLLILSKRTG